MNKEKKRKMVVEATRQALNSTPLDEHYDIFMTSYRLYKELVSFATPEKFLTELRIAGLKGVDKAYKKKKVTPCQLCNVTYNSPTVMLYAQTGLINNDKYWKMIIDFWKRKQLEKFQSWEAGIDN